MTRYCRYCGKPVGETAKFCRSCGKQLTRSAGAAGSAAAAVQNTASRTPSTGDAYRAGNVPARASSPRCPSGNTSIPSASASPGNPPQNVILPKLQISDMSSFSEAGEMVLGDYSDTLNEAAAQITNILSPAKAIFQTLRSFLGGIIDIFKNPKALIFTLLMAAIWFMLGLMQDSDIRILQILSNILYGKGGFGTNVLSKVGGILGKGTAAAGLSSIFTGGLGAAVKGIGSLFRTKGEKRSLILTIIGLIFGAGLFYFYSGMTPSAETASAGIAGALLSLEVLGNKNSIFYQFIRSLTSKAKDGVRSAMNGRCDSLLTGMTLGFTLGSVLSFVL